VIAGISGLLVYRIPGITGLRSDYFPDDRRDDAQLLALADFAARFSVGEPA
jgi:hypothetical protein